MCDPHVLSCKELTFGMLATVFVFPVALFFTVLVINGCVVMYDTVTDFMMVHFVHNELENDDVLMAGVFGFILFVVFVIALTFGIWCVVCSRLEARAEKRTLLQHYSSDEDTAYKSIA